MGAIRLFLLLIVGLSVADVSVVAQRAAAIANGRERQAALRLSTTIVNERYCLEEGFRTLRWTLKLTYTNDGTVPILLDRKSTLIYRTMVSSAHKAAAARRYIYDQSVMFTNLNKAGMRGSNDPEAEAFITLRAGESYNVLKESGVNLFNGTKNTKDFLDAGDYFLQVGVATWYYFAEPEAYRERWREKGYLWSNNMTSEPMPFTVQRTPTFQQSNCEP